MSCVSLCTPCSHLNTCLHPYFQDMVPMYFLCCNSLLEKKSVHCLLPKVLTLTALSLYDTILQQTVQIVTYL